MLRGRALRVDAMHTPAKGTVEALDDAIVVVDEDGVIASVHRPGSAAHSELASSSVCLAAPPGALLVPGLVDLHIHAPQFPQLGTALDLPLEDWLGTYTFPLEARYEDLDFAKPVYAALVETLLGFGTTTAVYFATIHDAATKALADICIEKGQRAFVGRVAMDHPETCPDDYRDATPEEAIAGTRAVIEHIRTHPDNPKARVRPIITPRFVPACTDALLAGLGALAAETATPVTSHVSESDWEHAHVLDRFGQSDAETLRSFGLLRDGSVMAHGCFLSPDDMHTLRSAGTGVAHCPASNAYFANAAFPLRRALEAGLGVGLGTDISGGPSASLWETARSAIMTARMLESGTDPDVSPDLRSAHENARIDAATAFWLATAGGAEVLGLPVGKIAPSYAFDALLLHPASMAPAVGDLPPGQRLERVVYGTGRSDIAAVFVDGALVAGAMPR